MTEWTDERVGGLLTETMRERAADADPDRALTIALGAATLTERHRRPAVLVAAAVVAAAVAGTTYLVREDPHQETLTQPIPMTPSPSITWRLADTEAAYRAAAAAESERVLALAPVPTGATRIRHGSGALPPDPTVGLPGQASLTRTATYAVPLGPDQVRASLVGQVPAGMRVSEDDSGPDGVHHLVLGVRRPRVPRAYTNAFLLAEWRAAAGTTTLRFTTFIAARPVRTKATRVLDATSVVVTREDGPTRAFTDPSSVAELIDETNVLVGWPDQPPLRCPFSGVIPPQTTLTFRGTQGTTVFVWNLCGDGVHVSRNGREVMPHLDPGRLDAAVDRLLR